MKEIGMVLFVGVMVGLGSFFGFVFGLSRNASVAREAIGTTEACLVRLRTTRAAVWRLDAALTSPLLLLGSVHVVLADD